jgi:PAS domain S-box-containing protein
MKDMANHHQCKNLLHNPSSTQCMEHYGCIYENNHLITLMVDPANGKIVDANRAACEFYGYPLQEFRRMVISDLNGEQDGVTGGFTTKAAVDQNSKGINQVFYERHRLSSGKIIAVEIHTGMITMLGKTCIYTVIHDIDERAQAEQRLKESEERYRDLVELCPEAILVYKNGTILFANQQSEKLFGTTKDALIGQSLDQFLHSSFLESSEYRSYRLKEQVKESFRRELRFVRYDGRPFDLEVAGAPISYVGEGAVQLVLRDITESKKEIKRAVQLQEQRQAVEFPLPEAADLKKLYVPAGTLSGDFYIFHKINAHEVIGIIGDVTGKGITAALHISALRVMFSDSVLASGCPVEVLEDLNKKVMLHLDEDYIAACCFHLNFKEGVLKAAGAGINEFIYIRNNHEPERRVIKGAPMGMFGDSRFDEETIAFAAGDRFCFFSDGLELLGGDERIFCDYDELQGIIQEAPLKDDCTWLSLNIR